MSQNEQTGEDRNCCKKNAVIEILVVLLLLLMVVLVVILCLLLFAAMGMDGRTLTGESGRPPFACHRNGRAAGRAGGP